MKYQIIGKQFSFFAFLTFLFYLNSCRDLGPESNLVNIYTSPKINVYRIERVALLPMAQDDTTDSGTFYSTNHFFNSLKQNYPEMKFVIPAIEVSDEYDTLIPNFVESIEKLKRLDLTRFFETPVGSSVDEENPDAILIGRIDNKIPKSGFVLRSYAFANVISCEFRYYLISLVDGRVLWKAEVLGEEGYYVSQRRELFPPIDLALSNGIDKIIPNLPFTKNSEQNNQQEK
ncbi:MAG: hypothetical protein NTX65_16380 [Ignavibacteriales bacterium]|nr:hypothetical protein [Ignavibacteriales bacterium]